MKVRWLAALPALCCALLAVPALAQVAQPPVGVEAVVWQPTAKGLPKAEIWRWDASLWQRARPASEVSWPVDGVTWTLKTQPRVVPYTLCSCLTDDEVEQIIEQLDRLGFAQATPARCRKRATVQVPVAISAGKVVPLVEVPADLTSEDGSGSFEFQVFGAVGPYVLTATHADGYVCGGVHGSVASKFRVVDLRTGKAVTPWTPQLAAGVVAQTKAALLASVRKDGGELEFSAVVSVSALRIGWRAGQLAPKWLITGSACYACSDGVWDSYSRSLWVANTTLPPLFAPVARLDARLTLLSAKLPGAIAIASMPIR